MKPGSRRHEGTKNRSGRAHRAIIHAVCACAAVCAGALAAAAAPLAHAGRLDVYRLGSTTLGTTRTIRVWVPPGFRKSGVRYDVLYLNDGQNLFGDGDPGSDGPGWQADSAAARLIADRAITPLIIVGIDNGGDRARGIDYLPVPDPFEAEPEPPGADRYLTFVIDEVMPFVNRKYPTATGPGHTGFGGSSYGAASAFYAVLARPGVFGRLLLESPSVGVGNGLLLERARTMTVWPERIDIGIGSEEGRGRRGPSDALQTLVEILKAAGLDDKRLRVVVQEGGRHNEASWAARLPDALAFLFRATEDNPPEAVNPPEGGSHVR